ncbi:hypothetical protein Dimus_013833 [Dionaea muscipula]
MIDNGLENVMEIIKRQKWEKLLRRRELVHIDAVKEFYAKLTMSHNRKKDVAKSKVRGVEIEFDHQKPASILGIPGNNGICEYIKELRGNQDQERSFLMQRMKFNILQDVNEAFPAVVNQDSAQQKKTETAGVDPSGPSGHLPETVMSKLQAEFERACADRIQADLEKAQAENARLLALLQQAQNLPKP